MSPRKAARAASFDRREFMKMGSIAAVGLALPSTLLRAAAPVLPILSVGYAPDLPREIGETIRLRAASELLAGDPYFIAQSARVRIGTFGRSPNFADAAGGVDLDVIFPSYGFQPEEYPHFQAWRFRHADGLQTKSQAVSVTVPVTPTEGLRMIFRAPQSPAHGRAVKSEAAAQQAPGVLTLDTGVASGVPKLLRGAYVVALRESDGEREPNWDIQALARGAHGLMLNSSAIFTHLILTVDYAI